MSQDIRYIAIAPAFYELFYCTASALTGLMARKM